MIKSCVWTPSGWGRVRLARAADEVDVYFGSGNFFRMQHEFALASASLRLTWALRIAIGHADASFSWQCSTPHTDHLAPRPPEPYLNYVMSFGRPGLEATRLPLFVVVFL